MVLFIIGLGLGDEKDITVKGLEAVKRSEFVFLEAYTSILGVDVARLEKFYEKNVTIADRNLCEIGAESIYGEAKTKDVSFLVVGDPFCATTHSDLILRAQEEGIKVEIIHNASCMGAVGCCGLQLYSFGVTVSIPFFRDEWKPDSFYEKIAQNRTSGAHTLCLLDIKTKEPDFEAMARGKEVFLPPRYMTVNEAAAQLLYIEEQKRGNAYNKNTLCVGLARLGQHDQRLVSCSLQAMMTVDIGGPLHCMVIAADGAGQMHELERKMLEQFRVKDSDISDGMNHLQVIDDMIEKRHLYSGSRQSTPISTAQARQSRQRKEAPKQDTSTKNVPRSTENKQVENEQEETVRKDIDLGFLGDFDSDCD